MFKIESRKQLKDLLDWYEELLDIPKWGGKKRVITHIFTHYSEESNNGMVSK